MKRLSIVLIIVIALIAIVVPSTSADVTGSGLAAVNPSPLVEGSTVDVTFSVLVVANIEYLDRFEVTLPAGWVINSVTTTAANACGATAESGFGGQTVYWQTVGYPTACGAWYDTTVDFVANITVSTCGTLDWLYIGDYWGSAPHTVGGTYDGCSAAAATGGAGRDMVAMPDTAVVGKFNNYTPLYYMPAAGATSDYAMEPGQSLFVLGVDASGQFYKVLMSGSYFWAPVSSMGPNYDDVWNGMPLPTNVVD